jgi:hypothetical protein
MIFMFLRNCLIVSFRISKVILKDFNGWNVRKCLASIVITKPFATFHHLACMLFRRSWYLFVLDVIFSR